MKKILFMLLLIIITITIFALPINTTQIGEVSIKGSDDVLRVYVNEKALIYFEADNITFTLSGVELGLFKRIMAKNLELAEAASSVNVRYKRNSGQMYASYPATGYLAFDFYTSGTGASTITLNLFQLGENGVNTRVPLMPENAKKLLSLIKEASTSIADKTSQIATLNAIVATIPKY